MDERAIEYGVQVHQASWAARVTTIDHPRPDVLSVVHDAAADDEVADGARRLPAQGRPELTLVSLDADDDTASDEDASGEDADAVVFEGLPLTGLSGLTPEDPGWQELALCAQTDPEAFFPEKGGSTREAKRVCQSCEVRQECLEYALGNDERFGIWGGLSERERRRLKRAIG